MGAGQPVMQGKQSRLGAEAQNHAEYCRQRQGRGLGHGAARRKGQALTVEVQHHHAKQRHKRAAHRVEQVLVRAHDGLFLQLVQHQRCAAQGGQLIKQVQRHHIRRQRGAQQHRLGGEQEHIEPGLAAAVGHVHGGVGDGQQPAHRRHHGEHRRHAVHLQREGQRFGEIHHTGGPVAAGHGGVDHQRRQHSLGHCQNGGQPPCVLLLAEGAGDPQQEGQQKDQIQHMIHSTPFLNSGRTDRSPAAAAPSAARNGYR